MCLPVHPHPHQFAVLLRYYRAANLAVIRPFRKTAEARCRSHQMHRLTTTRALGTFVPVRPGEWIGARLIHDCSLIACLGCPNIDLRQLSIPMCGASALGSDAQSSAMLIDCFTPAHRSTMSSKAPDRAEARRLRLPGFQDVDTIGCDDRHLGAAERSRPRADEGSNRPRCMVHPRQGIF